MASNYDLIVIGKGVAGSTLAYFAQQARPNLTVAVLHSSQNEPCSWHSTGIVSTFGVKPDAGPRGEKICASFHLAENFFAQARPAGVEKVPHFFNSFQEKGYCYLVTPQTYLNWLKEQSSWECWDERVEAIDGGRVRTASGKIFEGRWVVLASGAYVKRENKFFPEYPYIDGSSIVKGSYGIFHNVDWEKSSFVFSQGGANLVYRREDKKIVIGGTTDRGEGMTPDTEALREQYLVLSNHFALPPFESIWPGAGLRHRGVKRMPFWGKLEGNVYGILGLYKNGWSLSFLAAEEMLQGWEAL